MSRTPEEKAEDTRNLCTLAQGLLASGQYSQVVDHEPMLISTHEDGVADVLSEAACLLRDIKTYNGL
jgi:hypothetical protein